MTKIGIGLSAIVFHLSSAIAGNHWYANVPGGLLQFRGELVANTCTVEAGDIDQTVQMGQVRTNQFHYVGEDINAKPFTIHLLDCSTSVSRNLSVFFRGVADGNDPDVLTVDEGTGSASGVGIALFDNKNNLIAINQTPQNVFALSDGNVDLNFVAKYRATHKQVSAGTVNAMAWFSFIYL